MDSIARPAPDRFPIEDLIEALPDHVDDVILICEATGQDGDLPRILWVNRRFREMFGQEESAVLGKPVRVLLKAGDGADPTAELKSVLASWKPGKFRVPRDGAHDAPRWIEFSLHPVADAEGFFHYWVLLARDVSEVVSDEKALAQALATAEAAERTQMLFLSTMNHEIRTPLNGILGVAQILKILGPLNPEQEDALAALHEAGEVLLKLMDDLLEMSELQAGTATVREAPVFAQALVQRALAAVRARSEAKGIEIWTSIDSRARLGFMSDERRLLQILIHLLDNAVKFAAEGHVKLSVRRPAMDEIVFDVEDSGPGIAPADQDKIFEAFRRLDDETTRRLGGAGVGLALAQEFAQMLGGSITLRSELGKGSTFRLSLPVKGVPAEPLPTAPATPRGTRPTILIVEDDRTNRTVMDWAFKQQGWRTMLAEDGHAALALVGECRPDVIVLDRNLPGLSGDDVLQALKAAGADVASIPVVMATADATIEAEHKLLAAGAARFFSKPLDLRFLVRAAGELIGLGAPEEKG